MTMYSSEINYSNDVSWNSHHFPHVICEDDAKPIVKASVNHVDSHFVQSEDSKHSFDYKFATCKFPEIICEDDAKPIVKTFAIQRSSLDSLMECDDIKQSFDIKINRVHAFPEVICEDDAIEPIQGQTEFYASSVNCHQYPRNSCPVSQIICEDRDLNVKLKLNETAIYPKETKKDEIFDSLKDVDSFDDQSNFCQQDDEEDRMQDSILTSLTELEEAVFKKETHKLSMPDIYISDAAELLSAQADLIKMNDPWKLLEHAITTGRTIQLTEAGQQALAMIKPNPVILPFQNKGEEIYKENMEAKSKKLRSSHSAKAKSEKNAGSGCYDANTCNAVILRSESIDNFQRKSTAGRQGLDNPSQNYESPNEKSNSDSELSELDENLQILSSLYETGQLRNSFSNNDDEFSMSENLLQYEISNILHKIKRTKESA